MFFRNTKRDDLLHTYIYTKAVYITLSFVKQTFLNKAHKQKSMATMKDFQAYVSLSMRGLNKDIILSVSRTVWNMTSLR